MGVELLTSLSRVKGWLSIPDDNTSSDATLSTLIKNASTFVLNHTNRKSFAKQSYASLFHGYGQTWMTLPEPNVIAVSAVSVGGVPMTACPGNGITTPMGSGFAFVGDRLELFGYRFPSARNAVHVSYTAGFFIADEPQTVPDSAEYELSTDQFWVAGESVKRTDGTAMELVTGAPITGQYAVSNEGRYTFAAADAGVNVLISYSYAPADVVEATTEIIGERWAYKDRVGHSSKSLGGQETISFTANSTPPHVLETLDNYQRVI